MPTGKPQPTPPHLIAANGHIAAALREYMTQHNLTAGDFNQSLGYVRGSTGIYQWLRANAAPGNKLRAKIHKVTGIPLASLTPRDVDKSTQVTTTEPRAVSTILRPMSPNPVLQFTVSADGTARIKLDAAMSLAAASPLLRILLDAGLLPTTQGDDNGSVQ